MHHGVGKLQSLENGPGAIWCRIRLHGVQFRRDEAQTFRARHHGFFRNGAAARIFQHGFEFLLLVQERRAVGIRLHQHFQSGRLLLLLLLRAVGVGNILRRLLLLFDEQHPHIVRQAGNGPRRQSPQQRAFSDPVAADQAVAVTFDKVHGGVAEQFETTTV